VRPHSSLAVITGLIFQTHAGNSSAVNGQTEAKTRQKWTRDIRHGLRIFIYIKKEESQTLFQSRHFNCVGGKKKEKVCLKETWIFL